MDTKNPTRTWHPTRMNNKDSGLTIYLVGPLNDKLY